MADCGGCAALCCLHGNGKEEWKIRGSLFPSGESDAPHLAVKCLHCPLLSRIGLLSLLSSKCRTVLLILAFKNISLYTQNIFCNICKAQENLSIVIF